MEKRKKEILVLLSISIFLVGLIFFPKLISNKETIPIKFILSENKIGFDLTQDELNFGMLTKNNSASRKINITNQLNNKVKVTIKSSKEIIDNLIVSENNFILEPEESKEISFTILTTKLTEFREYNGEIIIISKRILL
ncbi:MAG: hypothetical protein ABIF88_02915 [archaeon]